LTEEDPEDEKGIGRDILGSGPCARGLPRLGTGEAQATGKRQEGNSAAMRCRALLERINPLKGKPHERYLSETWRDGGGRNKSLRGRESLRATPYRVVGNLLGDAWVTPRGLA
jgi:hypothetical protein